MIKRTNIIYFSPTGTTAKITQHISKGLGLPTVNYDLTLAKDRNSYKQLTINNDELVIVGIPVYGGRIPELLEESFAKFNGNNTPAVFIAVYGNRHYDDALLELKTIFEKRGFKGIAAGAFLGEHSFTSKLATNRPNTNDLNSALQFGKKIKSLITNCSDFKDIQISVSGNFPYKERKAMPPMGPETNEKCNDCGICAKVCPVEAIDFTNFRDINPNLCIRCNICVKNCPENAKAFTNDIYLKLTQKLINNFSSTQKEPELFF